jgi:hypothetical protein
LTGGLTVLVVRYSATYFATDRLMLPAAEGRRVYRIRSQLEEVILTDANDFFDLRAKLV